jgi:hypothetical protein
MRSLEPVVHPIAIASLRPTQVTVGFREVAEKRRLWSQRAVADGGAFLGRHMIPAVLGPKGRYFVIDHHHLVLALHQERVRDILVSVQGDLSGLDKNRFWTVMDSRAWCHPYNAQGRRIDFADLPKSVADLTDDPYRSLAGAVRRAGGYAKVAAPFAEFLWADFLRDRVAVRTLKSQFDKALKQALALAVLPDAAYLPGWCGSDPQ